MSEMVLLLLCRLTVAAWLVAFVALVPARRERYVIDVSALRHWHTTAPLSFCQRSGKQKKTILEASSIHQDSEGNCIYGKKSYWDDMYQGDGDRSAVSYSWYCGWNELQPFWSMLVPNFEARVLIAGIGNDPTPVDMYDAGYQQMTAFDYSIAGVERARSLFGIERHHNVNFLTADARNLPLSDGSVEAILDKGTLDAIYITSKEAFLDSVKEMERVTAANGIIVSLSRVILQEDLLSAFSSSGNWEVLHDGALAFASDGGTSLDLGAELFSWRRK